MSITHETAVERPVGPPQTVKVHLHRLRDVGKPHALSPTDVLFDDKGQAFHNAGGKGPVGHHDAHAFDSRTVVALRAGVDQVVWVANEPFAVVRIEPHAHEEFSEKFSPDHPHVNPFDELKPPVCGGPGQPIRTGPPRKGARGRYKVTFAIGNRLVDPDIEIFP